MTSPLKWHGGIEVVLTNGKSAIVDDEDFDRINSVKWYCDSLGYARRNLGDGKCVYMHREIMAGTSIVDHTNGDKLDNRKSNLRSCTKSQLQVSPRSVKLNASGLTFEIG